MDRDVAIAEVIGYLIAAQGEMTCRQRERLTVDVGNFSSRAAADLFSGLNALAPKPTVAEVYGRANVTARL